MLLGVMEKTCNLHANGLCQALANQAELVLATFSLGLALTY